jgi:hypothetical protein
MIMLIMMLTATSRLIFLTCIDKLSKFAIIEPINSHLVVDIKPALIMILRLFKNTELVMTDNEKGLMSFTIRNF